MNSKMDPFHATPSIVNIKPENRVLFCRWAHEGLYDKQSLAEVGGEWYGPLKPPKEQNEQSIS